MVFPRAFTKVVLSGTMLGGREIWSASLSLDAEPFTGDRQEDLQDRLLPGILTAASTWFSDADTRIHQSAQLRTIKANMIGTDGRYSSDSVTNYLDLPEGQVLGGATSGMLPPQSSAAVSLVTSKARGLASRGRFYPPALAVGLDATTGGLPANITQAMAGTASRFLGAINALGGYTVCVVSEMREGAIEPVTGVEVGSIVDTQRRRRSALPEVYAAAPVAGG